LYQAQFTKTSQVKLFQHSRRREDYRCWEWIRDRSFPSGTGLHARQVIMSGLSMGGEITTAEIEAYRGEFAGAMPYCGVLAGNNLFGCRFTDPAPGAHPEFKATVPCPPSGRN
jgi:hypothetical protein